MRAPPAPMLLAAVALAACERPAGPGPQTEAGRLEDAGRSQVAPVPVSRAPSRETVQQAERLLPEGSPPDAVLKLLGEPASRDGRAWKYEFSYADAEIAIRVAFGSDGKVSGVRMIFTPLCM